MIKKRILRGFTLVELIVVIAVFLILLVAATSILGPVSGVFKSANEYTSSVQIVDNVSRYIEDNLRYANRMEIVDQVSVTDDAAYIPTKIQEFRTRYCFGTDASKVRASQYNPNEIIYVMKIDNPAGVSDLNADELNSVAYLHCGKISEWQYEAYTGNYITKKEWAVNELYYDDYSFTVNMGEWDDTSATFETSPARFVMNINLFKNVKKAGNYVAPYLQNTNLDNVVAFPLENVATSGGSMMEEIYIYKDASHTEAKKDDTVQRYTYNNEGSGNDIYIIYTKAPKVETLS